MKLLVDTHTHTISSGHAYSTVQEMAAGASINGIEAIAITDHGPSLTGAPTLLHFWNLKILPQTICGVRIYKGVEANIIDYSGKIDVPDEYLRRLDFAMASFHDICIKPSTVEDHTNAVINALKNPYIDAVAHPGNPQFQIDIEKVVLAARQYGKLLEINNHSFYIRTGSERNCREIALKCNQYGTRITCGSDAHISFDTGKFEKVVGVLEDVKIDEKLVLSTSVERFESYLSEKAERIRKTV